MAFPHFLAGQLALAHDFAVPFAPTINAYKRWQSLSSAPTAITWGHDNRTCGCHVVGRGKSFRIDNLLPAADAHPYLAFAGMIGVGMHGIADHFELLPSYQGKTYLITERQRLPSTLRQASHAFEGNTITPEILGDDVVD
jgi:glutamine synthetase